MQKTLMPKTAAPKTTPTKNKNTAAARFAKNLASLKGSVLITFHSLGDVDAAASAAVLQQILAARGMRASVHCVDAINSQAKRVLAGLGFPLPQPLVGIDAPSVILVDVSNADLLGEWGAALSQFRGALFVLDHHYHNKHIATAKGRSLVEPRASSTAELVIEIARALGVRLEKRAASLLLCAIISDTAGFKSASNATLRAACELASLGADYAECAALSRSRRDASETLAVLKCVGNAQIEKLGAGGATLAAFGKAHSHELACAAALVELGCDYAFVANEREGKISGARGEAARGSVGKIMEAAGRSFGASGSGGGHEKVGGACGEPARTAQAVGECLAQVKKLVS
jgi:nanoRNase/pAp phosphatase (c-di-AMP/oligoRNAs hydrolase)